MKRPRVNQDQAALFGGVGTGGYISPVTGDVCVHPPLCACGQCQMPVEYLTGSEALATVPESN